MSDKLIGWGTPEHVQALIAEECDGVKELLIRKNKEYGNSAIAPKRIFSKADAVEQIKVRIDDKLSRLMNDDEKNIKEDTEQDLIGYLVLLRVARQVQKGLPIEQHESGK